MSSLLSLGFEYKGVQHSFLARVKEDGDKINYHITVMNGDLEKLLYGNHIITSVNGRVITDSHDISNTQQLLRLTIVDALTRYLQEKALTSY